VRRGLVAILACALAAGTGVCAASGTARSAGPCGTATTPPVGYRHVILIVLENHSFTDVVGRSPYLNRLARLCGLAAGYRAITHPSLPNYLALTSGSTDGITDDCTGCRTSARSLFEQLDTGWRAYEEGLPRPGFTGVAAAGYVKRHNPAAYYTRIARAYRTQAVPLTTLSTALARDWLPRFAFVTPDLCHDEHDCPVRTGDAWLAHWLPRILSSRTYSRGSTALFVTYDEGSDDNRVYTVVVSPTTKPGTVSSRPFTHYSLLRTLEQLLAVPCLQHACDRTTSSMRSTFRL
jgi:phospholipase C